MSNAASLSYYNKDTDVGNKEDGFGGKEWDEDLLGVLHLLAHAAACGLSTAGPQLSDCNSSSLRLCSRTHGQLGRWTSILYGCVVTSDVSVEPLLLPARSVSHWAKE